ncbi:MAG: AAA family ATPase [Pseudomonadota bacterium]
MRIERLDLIRFGHFEGRSLNLSPAPLTVILGANESGKSTAIAAIADTLYGIEARTPFAFLHGYDGLRLGACLRAADGSDIAFERRKGRRSVLFAPDGKELPEDALQPFLGGVDRAGFLEAFALNQGRLREGAQAMIAGRGALEVSLLAAMPGLSGLFALRDTLSEEAAALYAPRKAGLPFGEALARHTEARARRNAETLSARQMEEAETALVAAREAVARLDAERKSLAVDQARLNRLRLVAPVLARLAESEAETEALGSLPCVSSDFTDRAREALANQRQATERSLEAKDRRAAQERARDALAPDHGLLVAAAEIEALEQQRTLIEQKRDALPKALAARDAAEAALAALIPRLGLDERDALDRDRPDDARLAAASSLLDRAERRQEEAEADAKERTETEASRAALQRSLDSLGPALNVAALRDRLETLGDPAQRADHLSRTRSAAETLETRLAAVLAKLPAPLAEDDGPMADRPSVLLARQWPPAEAVEASVARLEELERRRTVLLDAGRDLERDCKAAEAERRALSAGRTAPSPAGLTEARQARDRLWPRAEAAMTGQSPPLDAEAGRTFRQKIDAADRIADSLISGAESAAHLQALERAAAVLEAKLQAQVESLAQLEAEARSEKEVWEGLWRPVAPALGGALLGAPRAGTTLMAQRDTLSDIAAQHAEAAATAKAAAQEYAAAEAGLRTLARDLGLPDEDPAAALHAACRRHLQDAEFRTETRLQKIADLQAAEARLHRLEMRATARATEADAERDDWGAAVRALGLPKEAGIAALRARIEAWGAVASPAADLAAAERQIETLRSDLQRFVDTAAKVLTATHEVETDPAAPQKTATADQALAQTSRLTERLRLARNAAARREQAEESLARAVEDEAAALHAKARTDKTLRGLSSEAGVETPAALAAVTDRLASAAELAAQCAADQAQLTELAPGAPAAALREDLAEQSIDKLDAAIEEKAAQQERLEATLREALAELSEAKARHAALAGATGAADAAQDVAEAEDRLVEIAEEWLTLRIAVDWIGDAARSWLAERQTPLLARASAAFATATSGDFAQIEPDLGAGDKPTLVAVRADGRRLGLDGLSEGTADQLFLALRVAAVEAFAAQNRALPFIADDVFVTFDDRRAEGGLKLLAELGDKTQVLVLTHHPHLAELAQNAVPDAKILNLSSQPVRP